VLAGEHEGIEPAGDFAASGAGEDQPVVAACHDVTQVALAVIVVDLDAWIREKHVERVLLVIDVPQGLAELALGQRAGLG